MSITSGDSPPSSSLEKGPGGPQTSTYQILLLFSLHLNLLHHVLHPQQALGSWKSLKHQNKAFT